MKASAWAVKWIHRLIISRLLLILSSPAYSNLRFGKGSNKRNSGGMECIVEPYRQGSATQTSRLGIASTHSMNGVRVAEKLAQQSFKVPVMHNDKSEQKWVVPEPDQNEALSSQASS